MAALLAGMMVYTRETSAPRVAAVDQAGAAAD
jgi:hypothetical protein